MSERDEERYCEVDNTHCPSKFQASTWGLMSNCDESKSSERYLVVSRCLILLHREILESAVQVAPEEKGHSHFCIRENGLY